MVGKAKKTTEPKAEHKPAKVHDEEAAHKEIKPAAKAQGKAETLTKHEKPKHKVVESEINIGMIGHVDHGKTSLTKALTGKWCDTHSEEVKRGISIRLGYADVTFYKLKTPAGVVYSNTDADGEVLGERTVSFVDAPGHETLMTTMLSGAALMKGAVLVIAANEDCPQARTIEHLMALKFAGVDKIVVAQNKIDLITKEEALAQQEKIKKFLKDYGYGDSPIVPTSANFCANIDTLIEAIETHIPTPKYDLAKPLKMFVARSFDINKPGTLVKDLKGAIIGGCITQGSIKVGDELELCPGIKGSTKTKVISISTSNGLINEARPGGLIGVGTTIDPSIAQNDQLRGQILAAPSSLPAPVKAINLKMHLFERKLAAGEKVETAEKTLAKQNEFIIKVTEPLVLTIGTNTVVGFVTKTDAKTHASLTLKNEVIAEKGEKVALSKNVNGQWRLIAYGEAV